MSAFAYANNEGGDELAHLRGLICTLIDRYIVMAT